MCNDCNENHFLILTSLIKVDYLSPNKNLISPDAVFLYSIKQMISIAKNLIISLENNFLFYKIFRKVIETAPGI